MKVTLWYTGLIVIIMALVLGIILASSDKILLLNIQNQLEESVEEGLRDIDYKNGQLEIDDDFEHYDDGVTLLIYDENGTLLKGTAPSGFDHATPIDKEGLKTINQNGQEWLLYDYPDSHSDKLWIRGVYQLNQLSSTMNTILLVTLVAFPFLIIVAAVGGYYITKRAFRPIQKMIDTVSEINDGQDLSKRIDLEGSNDEIHALAQTFDRMFDRLQTSFENEKQFTSDASHELRTPTSVIISQSEYALSQLNHPEEVKDSLDVILNQSKKMSNLISQLLLLARVDQKNMNHFLFERINMSELTEMVAEELSYVAKKRNIELRTDIEDYLFVEADQTLLMRLLMNLINNAIAYGRENGYVSIKLYKQESYLIGEISDNGIGIDQKNIHKIWDRFYRVDPSRTSTANGNTGLGLAIVKWIVDFHGGTIQVASELNKGSTFTFRLPLKVQHD